MRHIIDIDTWKRKEEYLFFKTFLNPMVAVTVEVDCTIAYQKAKREHFPLSLYYLHAAIIAANHLEEFRYRQEEDAVVLYDRIDLFTPVSTADGSYRSVLLPAEEDWDVFLQKAVPIVERAKAGEGRAHGESEHCRNILLISVNPWYRFTSVQLTIPQQPHMNIPIFTFGKIVLEREKWVMPVSLSVNHGFVSGYQIGRFLEEFQRLLDR